jgi:glycine oxidase
MRRSGAGAADVAVIGAGLVGLAVAYELAKRGAEVTIYERDEPARAASWAGAGMLAPFSESMDDALLEFCRQSLAAYPDFVAELHERTSIDARFRRNGTLHIALDEADGVRLRVRASTVRANGGDAVLLERGEVLAREPFVAKHVAGGLLVTNEGQVDNRRLGRALVAAARGSGVRFERVGEIAVACDERRVRGVRTPQGFAAASTVVNAAGAWAAQLAGIPAQARVPVRPVAGEMFALALPAGAVRAQLWHRECYLVPRDDGRLLVGATSVERGFDARVTAAGLHQLLDAAISFAPPLGSFAVAETWAGLRPATPDGRPYIGATALEGYVVACGHHRNGILLAPQTGRLVAELIVTGSEPPLLAPFSPRRAAVLGEGLAATANPAS